MVVLAPIKGSPADQAGIQPGDEVSAAALAVLRLHRLSLQRVAPCRQQGRPWHGEATSVAVKLTPRRAAALCALPALPLLLQLLNVDGTSISGLDTDGVAAKLRGQEGSSVWIKVARRRTVSSARLLRGAARPPRSARGSPSLSCPWPRRALPHHALHPLPAGDPRRGGPARRGARRRVQAVPPAPRPGGAEPRVCHHHDDGRPHLRLRAPHQLQPALARRHAARHQPAQGEAHA